MNVSTTLSPEYSVVYGCGRTDAGVHAKKYLCSFKTECKIPVESIPLALNSRLPEDIVVYSAFEASETFNGRFSVTEKTYRYIINNSKYGTAIYRNLETHIPVKLDVEKMKKAIKYFEGEHDFKAFVSEEAVKSNVSGGEKRN